MTDQLRFPAGRSFPCPRCGQDLRGLALNAACPKCSEAVHGVFIRARAGELRSHQGAAFRIQRAWLRVVAQQAGVKRSAAEFVLDAVGMNVPHDRRVTARSICEGLGKLARTTFSGPAEAREMLMFWGINRSEDVGRVIEVLVAAGLARAEGVTPGQFKGLFVTDRWMS